MDSGAGKAGVDCLRSGTMSDARREASLANVSGGSGMGLASVPQAVRQAAITGSSNRNRNRTEFIWKDLNFIMGVHFLLSVFPILAGRELFINIFSLYGYSKDGVLQYPNKRLPLIWQMISSQRLKDVKKDLNK